MDRKEFIKLLETAFNHWKPASLPKTGMRRFTLNDATVDVICNRNQADEFIRRLRDILPNDAVLNTLTAQILDVLPSEDGRLTSDRYIEFASNHWPSLPPDSNIIKIPVDDLVD